MQRCQQSKASRSKREAPSGKPIKRERKRDDMDRAFKQLSKEKTGLELSLGWKGGPQRAME